MKPLTQILFDAACVAYVQYYSAHSAGVATWRKYKMIALLFFSLSIASISIRFYGDAIELMSERGMEVMAQNMAVLHQESLT